MWMLVCVCVCVCVSVCLSVCLFVCIAFLCFLRTDLRNTDLNSEVFIRKLHRAHEALSQQSQQSDGSGSSGVKTLSASFGPKWPYKRTMSAPASIVPRQDTKQGEFLKPCTIEPASQVHTGKLVV